MVVTVLVHRVLVATLANFLVFPHSDYVCDYATICVNAEFVFT